jgi:hypothetical protein
MDTGTICLHDIWVKCILMKFHGNAWQWSIFFANGNVHVWNWMYILWSDPLAKKCRILQPFESRNTNHQFMIQYVYLHLPQSRVFFSSNRMVVLQDLSQRWFLVNHGKSPFLMGKLTKWQFSIAMLVYRGVSHDSDFQCICYWLVESAFPHGPSAAISPEIFHWAIDDALPVVEIIHH